MKPLCVDQVYVDRAADPEAAIFWPPVIVTQGVERFVVDIARLASICEFPGPRGVVYVAADGRHFRVTVEKLREPAELAAEGAAS